MKRRWRGCCATVVILAVGPLAAPATAAEAVDAGPATIVRPAVDGGTSLASGGSATRFTLRLPGGAACPHDSYEGDDRVQSFQVPEGADVAAELFGSQGPKGPDRHPLYDVTTSAYVNVVTAKASRPGGPGAVQRPPLLSLSVYAPGELAPGPYRVGIACTHLGSVDRYWSALMIVSRSPTDRPAGVTWTAPNAGSAPARGRAALLLLGLVATVGAAALVLRRRSKKTQAAALAEVGS